MTDDEHLESSSMRREADQIVDERDHASAERVIRRARGPFIMQSLAILLLVVAVVMLLFIVVDLQNSRKDRDAVDDCRALYGARVAEANREAIRGLSAEVGSFLTALSLLTSDQGSAVDLEVLAFSRKLADDGSVAWAAATRERDAWVNAGTPMPCPIDSTNPPRP